jgi:hypothetical protein
MGPGDDIVVALTLQLTHNGASYHATMASDVYFTVFIHFYGITS